MARITCPDESTPEFLELSNAVGSSTLALFLWRKNNYLPLDKIDVDGKEEVNPLYDEVLGVIAEGDRNVALKAIARTLMPEFQDKYGEEEIGSTIDFLKQDLEDLAEKVKRREQGNLQAEQSPNSIVLTIPTDEDPIIFNEEESTEIFTNLSFLSANYGPSEVLRLLNAKKEKIKAKIMADPDSVTEAEQQQATNIILLTKNWDTVVDWFKSQEPTFGLKNEEDSNTEKDDSEIDVEDFTGGVSTYNKNAHDRGQKELASAEVIKVVQALPQYKKLSTKEQKEIASGKRSIKDFVVLGSVLGLPLTGDFSKNWNLLSASLTGITDYNLIKEEIRSLSAIYPQFRNLYDRLPEANSTNVSLGNTTLAAAFQQVMSMPEIPAVKLSMKIVGNSYTTKVFELGTKTVINLINYFDADYASANPNLVLEDGSAVDINKLVSLFTYGNETLATRVADYRKNRNPTYFNTPEGISLLNELFKFHKAIGIIPTNSLYLSNKKAFKDFLIASSNETASLFTKLASSQENTSVTQLLSYLSAYQGSGPLSRLSDSVNSIVKFYGQFEREFASGSYLNPENKLQYNRVQYFYLTQISNTLNSVGSYSELIAKPEFAHLDIRKNPNVIGSLWLEKMFGLKTKGKDLKTVIDQLNQAGATGEVAFKRKNVIYSNEPFTINIQNYAGVSIAGNHKKNSVTTSLSPEDKILQDFFSFFSQGIVENVRFGDKGTSYATVLSGKPENRIYFKLDEEIMNERETVVPQASNAVVEQFTEYLKSEALRLKELLRKPGKSTYHKNGKNLFVFKDMLPEDVYSSLVNATTEEEIDLAYQNVKNDLKTYLDQYIQEQTQAVKAALMEAVYPDDSLLPNPTSPEQRLNTVISRLNQKKFMDTGINKVPINANNFDYVIANYFINDFVHKTEFFKVFVGDIANFQVKGDYREVFKRIPFTSSPGYVPHDNPIVNTFLANSPYTNGLQKVLSNITKPFRRTVRTVIFNDVNTFKPEDWEAYRNAMGLPDDVTYKEYVNNPKESDAQGLVTLDFYRNYLINISQWSQEQEDAYTNEIELFKLYQEPQSEERDEQIADLKDTINYVGFPPLKLGHYGAVVEDPRLVALHKYSLAPLIPSMIQGTQLESLNKTMLTQDVDYATFQSGSKASNHGESLDFYVEQALTSKNEQLKLKVNEDITDNNVTTLHLTNLKQQQYIAPKFKNEATLATQMVKLLFGDFYSNGTLNELTPSFASKIEELYNDYGQSLRDLVGIEKLKLYNKLGLQENPDGSLSGFDDKKFISFLRTEMDNRNVSNSLKRYIQVDENGNLLYPLDSAKNRTEIENIILSVINNRIISQKLHGEAYVQVASTGLGKQRYKKPTETQIKKFGINGLRNYRVENGKTQPADVKIAFNPRKHSGLLKLKFDGKTIGTIENLNAILTSDNVKEMEWVEKNSKQLILVGVRIPVQGFNSMEYMRVREFLPTSAGPVIVVPAGIVAKSGGDFDIDKLTMFEPVIDRLGNLVETENYNLDQYKNELPTRQESVQLLRYLRQAKKEIQSIIEELPNYQKSKELQKEIQSLKEALETKESTLLGMTGKTFNLEELQTKDENREQKEAELKAKYAQIRNLLKEGEVAEGLNIFKELQREIFETENSNFNKFEAAAGNRLINVMAGVMSLEENYNKIVLPNTNTILKAEADKLPSNPITSTGVFNLLVSNRVYSDNIEAKKALSIDAKINTIQKEFQIAGLRYTDIESVNSYLLPQHIMQDGSVALGMQNLVDGTSISRVISESINGHVDIAKEDWLILLGLDKVKTPLFHAMILSGTPVRESLEFLNRPIVKYALKEMNRGIIQSEMHYTKETLETRRASKTLQNLFDKFVLASKESRELVDAIKENRKQETKRNPSFRAIANDFLTLPEAKGAFLSSEASLMKDIASLAMLQNLRDRQSKIQQLNSLVDYNTKSYRSSYQKEAEDFTYAQTADFFNKEGLDILTKRSALSAFNVANTVSGLLDKAFPITGDRMVFNAINRFLNLAELYTQEDQVNAARTIKDNFILLTVHSQGVDSEGNSVRVKTFGEEGFVTKNNSNNLLVRLKALKETYPDITSNLLIENLYEEKVSVATPFIIFKLKNSNLDSYLIDQYEKSFLEGMKDIRPEVSQFFKDLGLANFMQFGFSKNAYGLNQVIPFEAYEEYTTQADKNIRENLTKEGYLEIMPNYLAGISYLNELLDIPHRLFNLGNIRTNYPSVYGNAVTFDYKLPEAAAALGEIIAVQEQVATVTTTQPSTQVQGINISTKSSDKLGRELTNPNWGAKNIMDIEAEYKANASKIKAPSLNSEEALKYDMNLMYRLQMQKFKAHPELVKEITDRGGVAFLNASEHTIGVKDSRWEGKGTNSNFIKVLIKSYQDSLKLTQPSTSVEGFQGYKGGFENTGKGTAQGDGKDKAMRQVANVFIGELSKNGKGSTFTSAKEIAQKQGEEPSTSGARYLDGDENKYVNEIYSASIKLKGQPLVVMLARNGKLAGQDLSVETKRKIKGLSEQGATFVVGDMLGVDSQFIDYLQEIGAKFTIYHTGSTPRIQVEQATTQPSTTAKPKGVEVQEQKEQKIISNEDLTYFKTYVDKSKGILPKEFFTSKTKFKEFFNPETGKRELAPQSSKWILNSNNLYDLVDKDGGEVYISNVDLNTGIKYPNTPNNSLGLEESCDLG